ncbi:MAG: hypothetical protein ACE5R6_04505 [Candidatus Heimdallarchaeota archaeon]
MFGAVRKAGTARARDGAVGGSPVFGGLFAKTAEVRRGVDRAPIHVCRKRQDKGATSAGAGKVAGTAG